MPTPNPFSLDAIAKSVHDSMDQAVANITPGHKRAILIDATSDGHAQAVLASKIGEHWLIGGGVDYDGDHVRGKVGIAGSW